MAEKNDCKTNSQCYIDTKGIDEKEFKVPVILSDETAVDRFNYIDGKHQKFDLILSHTDESIDLSRKDILGVFFIFCR